MVSIANHDIARIDPTEITSQIPEPVQRDGPAPQRGNQQTTSWLARRLRVATLDLGLSEILPDHWDTPTAGGLSFCTLSLRQADRLVRALEDLALDREPVMPAPGPGQLSLFENGS
jgi:hypothetical protein